MTVQRKTSKPSKTWRCNRWKVVHKFQQSILFLNFVHFYRLKHFNQHQDEYFSRIYYFSGYLDRIFDYGSWLLQSWPHNSRGTILGSRVRDSSKRQDLRHMRRHLLRYLRTRSLALWSVGTGCHYLCKPLLPIYIFWVLLLHYIVITYIKSVHMEFSNLLEWHGQCAWIMWRDILEASDIQGWLKSLLLTQFAQLAVLWVLSVELWLTWYALTSGCMPTSRAGEDGGLIVLI